MRAFYAQIEKEESESMEEHDVKDEGDHLASYAEDIFHMLKAKESNRAKAGYMKI